MLTKAQKYSIATILSVNTLEAVIQRINKLDCNVDECLSFAREIDKFYKRRDGFIPRQVCKIVGQAQ